MTSWTQPNRRRRTDRRTARVAPILCAGVLTACAPSGPADDHRDLRVTDRAGREVALAEPARRIASLVPAATDWILALGAADRLVVRTDHDASPLLADVPSVGGGLTPSVEWVAARRPDLVIAWGDGTTRTTVARLESLGIPVYVATAETMDDALLIAADLGRLLALDDTAKATIAAVRHGLAEIRDRHSDDPRPSILFLIGLDPVTGAAGGTFVDELITVAGGRNVLADLTHAWPPLSLEEVLRRDPDVILVGTTTAAPLELVRGRPGWRSLEAVRRARVYPVHPDQVGRWGPQIVAAADSLARLIHRPNRQ